MSRFVTSASHPVAPPPPGTEIDRGVVRLHQLKRWYRRGLIGPKDHPWTDQALSLAQDAQAEPDPTPTPEPILAPTPEPDKAADPAPDPTPEPDTADATQANEASNEESATHVEPTSEPVSDPAPEPQTPVKIGSNKWSITDPVEGELTFRTKGAAQAHLDAGK